MPPWEREMRMKQKTTEDKGLIYSNNQLITALCILLETFTQYLGEKDEEWILGKIKETLGFPLTGNFINSIGLSGYAIQTSSLNKETYLGVDNTKWLEFAQDFSPQS